MGGGETAENPKRKTSKGVKPSEKPPIVRKSQDIRKRTETLRKFKENGPDRLERKHLGKKNMENVVEEEKKVKKISEHF